MLFLFVHLKLLYVAMLECWEQLGWSPPLERETASWRSHNNNSWLQYYSLYMQQGLDGSTISFSKVLNIQFNCIRLLIGRQPWVLSTTSLVPSNNFRYILRKILKILFNLVPINFCLRTECKVYTGLNPDVSIQSPTLQVYFFGMILGRSFELWCMVCQMNHWMNHYPEWIQGFLWCTMICVILDHWSWSGSSHRKAP